MSGQGLTYSDEYITMREVMQFLREHQIVTRRYFLGAGTSTLLAGGMLARALGDEADDPELAEALAKLDSFFTPPDKFNDVSRGNPLPHSLSDEKKREVGLTRETWRLEILSDPENPVGVRKQMLKEKDTALDFDGLMKIAEKHAVRFPKVMTCLNIGCPLGMGIWEGVPLRELVWQVAPRDDVRRLFYYGYHNDDPKQIFRSSLPIGRVLEDPFGLPPVIVCYKLNGQWLTSERGGPVRIVVPEAYGFKSIKWLSHIVLTRLAVANDTYAEQGNDVESPLKSFAATLHAPREVKAGEKISLSGYAQVGISGVAKVQAWIEKEGDPRPEGDPYFATAPWRDMQILPPPKDWGGDLPDGKIPKGTAEFDDQGRPKRWPMPLSKIHWAGVYPPLAPGKYTLRTRTVDLNGQGQPLPRPFRKSGHAAIEQIEMTVT
jgi:DMSO/TMAO reductase YedYZ molybdopterin-dependent catalytic subunit